MFLSCGKFINQSVNRLKSNEMKRIEVRESIYITSFFDFRLVSGLLENQNVDTRFFWFKESEIKYFVTLTPLFF